MNILIHYITANWLPPTKNAKKRPTHGGYSLKFMIARLGGLIKAGYFELFARSACCQETRSSYVLLGDPLTPLLHWSSC